jgi:hypothetical protein
MAFENATALDFRSYRGLWGKGNVYLKQEDGKKALDNF